MNREVMLAMAATVAWGLFCTMGYSKSSWKMRYKLIYDIYLDLMNQLHKRDEEIGRLKKELDDTRIECQRHLESYEQEQDRTIRLVDGLMEAVESWKK